MHGATSKWHASGYKYLHLTGSNSTFVVHYRGFFFLVRNWLTRVLVFDKHIGASEHHLISYVLNAPHLISYV